jgi:hypothetical protein
MEIDEEKINYYIKRGYIDVEDHAKFKYIVEILRLFNIKVNGWMRGGYILNDNEGIMFTKVQNENWTDTVDEQYMYERFNVQTDTAIAKRNEYWGDKIIYVFRKEPNDDYEFIGCFQQDENKLDELFDKGIKNERPYKKIGSKVDLSKFN